MRIGVITGSGTNVLPGLQAARPSRDDTRFGAARSASGSARRRDRPRLAPRRGPCALSSHVNHRANVLALRDPVDAVIGVTVCGALDARSSSAA